MQDIIEEEFDTQLQSHKKYDTFQNVDNIDIASFKHNCLSHLIDILIVPIFLTDVNGCMSSMNNLMNSNGSLWLSQHLSIWNS